MNLSELLLNKITFLMAFCLSIFGLLKAFRMFIDGEIEKAKEKSAGFTAIAKLNESSKVLEEDLRTLKEEFDKFVDKEYEQLKEKFDKFVEDYYKHIQSELRRFQHIYNHNKE